MAKKLLFSIDVPPPLTFSLANELMTNIKDKESEFRRLGVEVLRLYEEIIDTQQYLFLFFSLLSDSSIQQAYTVLSKLASSLNENIEEGLHVYEFKLHPGDVYSGLKTQAVVIGVKEGMLDEYVRLHNQQPQIIHELCYANGFRKSSIFVINLKKTYLIQIQEFSGVENPELYQNPIYQQWLEVTGACQEPLPGESFWKPMQELLVIQY